MSEPAVLELPALDESAIATMYESPIMTTRRVAVFKFCLKGRKPLLCDRMSGGALDSIFTGQKLEIAPDMRIEERAWMKAYGRSYEKDVPVGPAVIPVENLSAALVAAGCAIQYGSGKTEKVTFSTKNTSFFGMIEFRDEHFTIFGPDGKPAEWVVDKRRGAANNNNGSAVCIVRPKWPRWCIAGYLDLNLDSGLSPDKALDLFTEAGKNHGLCSARPGNKMTFGMYDVTTFEWVGGVDPKTITVSVGSSTTAAKPKRATSRKKKVADEAPAPDATSETPADATLDGQAAAETLGPGTPLGNGEAPAAETPQ
ncbi:hypothetical protein KW786_00055 [Candidatus Parcubacteria bacterium]|nr:hypothetical protein [Candidatus Parcubacteria bacterium]